MDALDRELTAALAVEPSPEFVARVRARIAQEPAPKFWRMPRMLMAGAAMAVVVVVAVAIPRIDEAPVAVTARPSVRLKPDATSDVVVAPVRRVRARREPNPIQVVSIEDLPSAPIGTVVPSMEFDVVTMTGVHP